MYPLARAIARTRETGEISEYFALIEEPHCKGLGKQPSRKVKRGLKGKNVDKHNKENDKLMELISLKNQILPGKLEGAAADKFYMALYDLDEFREQIFEKNLLDKFNIPEDHREKIKKDDEALLNLGLEWVKDMLFGIKMIFGE